MLMETTLLAMRSSVEAQSGFSSTAAACWATWAACWPPPAAGGVGGCTGKGWEGPCCGGVGAVGRGELSTALGLAGGGSRAMHTPAPVSSRDAARQDQSDLPKRI